MTQTDHIAALADLRDELAQTLAQGNHIRFSKIPDAVNRAKDAGHPMGLIAETLGVSRTYVYQLLAEADQQ